MSARLLLLCLLFKSSWLTVEGGRGRRRHSAASPGRTGSRSRVARRGCGVPKEESDGAPGGVRRLRQIRWRALATAPAETAPLGTIFTSHGQQVGVSGGRYGGKRNRRRDVLAGKSSAPSVSSARSDIRWSIDRWSSTRRSGPASICSEDYRGAIDALLRVVGARLLSSLVAADEVTPQLVGSPDDERKREREQQLDGAERRRRQQ
jgi:hypothetical protein